MVAIATLHRARRETDGTLSLAEIFAGPAVADRFDLLVAFDRDDRHVAATYSAATGAAALHEITAEPPFVAPLGTMNLAAGMDHLESFVIGNRPHLLGYEAQPGILHFIPINDDLSAAAEYSFRRSHEPGPTTGFTTIKPFVTGQAGTVIVMGYNADNGAAAMYTVSVRASSPADVPPLFALVVWSHQWARNWKRFAFFNFGQSAFFLKTNVNAKAPNVNIDHVLDDPATGTVEVTSFLQELLPDNQTLSFVESFTLAHGEPHFVTYKDDGAMRLYRIWADSSGWDKLAHHDAPAGARAMRAFSGESEGLILLVC